MNMKDFRNQVRKLILENLDGRGPVETLFNYYTTKAESKKNSFGWDYTVKRYGDEVIDELVHIIMTEEGISEKAFSLFDEAIARAKSHILEDEQNLNIVEKCSNEYKRPKFCAEMIYDRIKKVPLNEKKKSEFEKLQDNKIPLTDEERKECFKQDATWGYASSIDPNTGKKVQKVCAIWKSKNKDGKITYISHTHRSYNTAKSLQAAINKFHNFIKSTA